MSSEEGRRPIRRALISVYDKTSLAELGQGLAAAGVEIVSTGTTAAVLAEAGVPVVKVEDLTGFPECLDGRVKTLHPKVHAGLLADLRKPAHVSQLADLGIQPFDLLVSNLYPFRETVARGGVADQVIEQIDIGGPSMVRAAAKNHPSVAVVVSPARYTEILDAMNDGGFTLEQRKGLAVDAFVHTASYDIAVASWLGNAYAPTDDGTGFPEWLGASWHRGEVLRYGENPHQHAALYLAEHGSPGIAQAKVLHGKQMSYNNYVDTDAARRAAYDFTEPCVAIIKHANPCGIAIGADIAEAHRKANACDPASAYGGVIATNQHVTLELAQQIAEVFTEVVCAPGFDEEALDLLTGKKNLRLLQCAGLHPAHRTVETRQISGGLLMQNVDDIEADGDDPANWTLQSGAAADAETLADLDFAWRASRSVKSNAILLASDRATVGVGMGQVNRVDAARLAIWRAGSRAVGSVCASDAYFPFADGLQLLIDAGVRAVVEPGGSIRDEEVVAAARAAGITLYFTGTRHFFH
ncbi:MAG: phosphoribosylaminoimidazolecarboxamide formyltransferase / cyclohydrolase [Actinomycetota bacterium]|nr:phosphoribosylaminoimidazolecarboxamide formyltransferase / cyclohydrolase [Actinomycetota bacterium]